MRIRCLAMLLVLLGSGCVTLIYERAAMDEGFAIGVGANTTYRGFLGGTQDLGGIAAFGVAPGLSIEMRNGFSEHFGIFGRFGASIAPNLKQPSNGTALPLGGDVNVGVKIAPFAPWLGSLRIATGLPNLIEGVYLLDLGERFTVNAGYGFPCGACLGAAYHIPLSEHATISIAAEGSLAPDGLPPAFGVGVAFGFPR